MHRPPSLAVLLALSLACRSGPRPPPPEALPPPDTGASAPTSVRIPGGPYALVGDLFIPEGDGPFPALVYNHGSERNPSLAAFGQLGRYFQAHGFVVLLPHRRGAGGSEGPFWQDEVSRAPASFRNQATVEALEREADDVMLSVAWLAARPEVDPSRLAVAGCSFGGIMTLLAAQRGDHLRAAVDFAGGAMTWARNGSMRERLRAAARAARVPLFLVQAANDFDTSPTEVLSAELEAAGRPHRHRVFPAHGTTPQEGHHGFCTRGEAEWGPEVLEFLREQGVGPPPR